MVKSILLCAGFGKRLKPISDQIPKPLLPINNRPLLSIWLQKLKFSGYGPFLINTHYLHDQFEIFAEKSEYKKDIFLSHEKKILGTAGTLIKNLEFLKNGGLFAHADNFCLADFKDFLNAHRNRPKSCLMTMMTFKTSEPKNCGIVELDSNKVVSKFYEKDINAIGNIANGAIYLLSKELIRELAKNFRKSIDFSNDIIPNFLNKIYTYHTTQPLIDIGTIENYRKANLLAMESNLD